MKEFCEARNRVFRLYSCSLIRVHRDWTNKRVLHGQVDRLLAVVLPVLAGFCTVVATLLSTVQYLHLHNRLLHRLVDAFSFPRYDAYSLSLLYPD